MNSAKVEGNLLSIDAEQVSVELKGSPLKVERADVFRLRYADIRMKHTLIAMGAGAVAFGLVTATNSGGAPRGGMFAGGAVIGTGLGALAGACLPIGKPLYESATPPGRKK